MSAPKSKSDLQAQLTELDELLEWFDSPDIDLDQALIKFDQGIKLTEDIKKQLTVFENKVTILKKRFDQETT